MTDTSLRPCRTCGGPIASTVNTRGGRPREHCHTCRPSKAAARRRQRDHEQLSAPCRRCGREIEHTINSPGRRRKFCHTCVPAQRKRAEVELGELLAAQGTTDLQRSVFSRAADLAEAGGWTPKAVSTLLRGLREVLGAEKSDQFVRLRCVRAALPAPAAAKLAAAVLAEHEVLEDDTVPSTVAWIERKCAEFPDGFRAEVRAWLLELHAGGDRPAAAAQHALRLLRAGPAPPNRLVAHLRPSA